MMPSFSNISVHISVLFLCIVVNSTCQIHDHFEKHLTPQLMLVWVPLSLRILSWRSSLWQQHYHSILKIFKIWSICDVWQGNFRKIDLLLFLTKIHNSILKVDLVRDSVYLELTFAALEWWGFSKRFQSCLCVGAKQPSPKLSSSCSSGGASGRSHLDRPLQ